jgi:hypothetical protein
MGVNFFQGYQSDNNYNYSLKHEPGLKNQLKKKHESIKIKKKVVKKD